MGDWRKKPMPPSPLYLRRCYCRSEPRPHPIVGFVRATRLKTKTFLRRKTMAEILTDCALSLAGRGHEASNGDQKGLTDWLKRGKTPCDRRGGGTRRPAHRDGNASDGHGHLLQLCESTPIQMALPRETLNVKSTCSLLKRHGLAAALAPRQRPGEPPLPTNSPDEAFFYRH